MITTLDVMLWNRRVGTLVETPQPRGSLICFYFDPAYLNGGYDLSPLRAPLSGVAARSGLPVYPEADKEFGGLPSFIADSLPDHWGNVVFSEWARARNIRSKDLSPLDRLAYIGRRGMGALEFVPPTSVDLETPFRVEISGLARLAQIALDEAKAFHAAMSPDFIIESLFKVGTSAGGRRPKAVINVNPATGECFSGQVPSPLPGFVPMIIKFDEHAAIPFTRIEYSYYLMAQAAGIAMMPSRLIRGDRETHFLTQRFDRDGDRKIHVQTLAAMNPLSSSYEDLFAVADRIGISPEGMRQLFMQMVMNVIAGNVDDHNKNFSFLMGEDGVWRVAPAYDFTFTVDHSAPFYVNRHSMTVNGKNHDISRADILYVARRFNIKGGAAMIESAVSVAAGYRRYASVAEIDARWVAIIEAEIARRCEVLGS